MHSSVSLLNELNDVPDEPLHSRLIRRRERWREIGGEDLILMGAQEDWLNGPPPQQEVVPRLVQYVGGKDTQMKKELQEEIDLGIARVCLREETKYILRSFLVPKPGGEYRKILDCTPINEYIRPQKFKMENQSTVAQVLQPRMWGVTVDISKAFHHIQVGEGLRPFLCTEYGQTLIQYMSMPFGLKSAPRIFNKIMRHCIAVARRKWPLLTFVQYMDDVLILAHGEQYLREKIYPFMQYMKGLGWLINERKSKLIPSQTFQYLGWEWSTLKMEVKLIKEKNNALRQVVKKWINLAKRGIIVQIRSLASLIGRLSQTRLQHRGASLYLSFLNSLKTKAV
jgi:hypothetical protein